MTYLTRSFGIEIECFLPVGQSRESLADAINAVIGARQCAVQGYSHSVSNTWKIITDGSLGDYQRGIEIVSPILQGLDSIFKAEKVCKVLTDFGCTINTKCGFHVHVGVGTAPLRVFKDLVSIYSVFESVIDSIMPNSRRASVNAYCRTMLSADLSRIQAARTFIGLGGLFTSGRYHKVNLDAFHRHQTVEFRQHSGTTDPIKVKNWILICLRIVDKAFAQNFNHSSFGAAMVNRARAGSKNYIIGEMISRPDGVTSQEALVVTGWKTISIPEIARFCGLQIVAQKRGRITRYFAANSVSGATLASFASHMSLDNEQRTYMQGRVNHFSSPLARAA